MNLVPLTDKQEARMVLNNRSCDRKPFEQLMGARGQNRSCHVPTTVSRMQCIATHLLRETNLPRQHPQYRNFGNQDEQWYL